MLKSIRKDPTRKPQPEPPKPKPITAPRSAGAVYVAYGDLARKAAQGSLKSLKSIHPGFQVAVISDKPLAGADIQITEPELDQGAREYKTQVYLYSPFEYTLYLDADTVVVGSLQAGFDVLAHGWDVAMAMDYRPTVGKIDHIPANDVKATVDAVGTGEYPHYNTGMLFFAKSPEAEELFCLWHEEWEMFHYRDQGAFVRAFHRSAARLWVLSWQWNTHRRERSTHIWHNHHSVDRGVTRQGNHEQTSPR